MPKKQTKKHNPKKQTKQKSKKIRSGGIVSGMINLDDILKKSVILRPFITNNSINYVNIDNFIKDRIDVLFDNLLIIRNDPSDLGLKLNKLIRNQLENALKSEQINNTINELIDDKIKRLSYNKN